VNKDTIVCAKVQHFKRNAAPLMLQKLYTAVEFVPRVRTSTVQDVLRQVLKELGLQLHPPHETFVDMARTLITLGIAKPVKA